MREACQAGTRREDPGRLERPHAPLLHLAARVTGREDYYVAALKNATFIMDKLKEDGRIHRTYKDGRARFNGYLEDYAMVADGLVALYEATFETRWLIEADALLDTVSELFWDEGSVSSTTPRPTTRNSSPARATSTTTPRASGTSVATEVLLKLALFLDRGDYRQRAEDVLEELRRRHGEGP